LHIATKHYQNLKRDYNSVLDNIKIKHRERLGQYQILHAQQIKKKNNMMMRKLKLSSNLINELKDDIQDETMMVDDLKQKVNEYEDIIDGMEHEYEETCQNYQTKIGSIEAYYTAIIAKNTPRYVMKQWVKNKTRGEYIQYTMILIASFN